MKRIEDLLCLAALTLMGIMFTAPALALIYCICRVLIDIAP